MKEYRLKDNPQNRTQHNLFLTQYGVYEKIKNKSEGIKAYLELNEYRLKIIWEGSTIFTPESNEDVLEVSKELFDKLKTENEKLIIKDGGSVSMGMTNPTAKLHIVGDIKDALDKAVEIERLDTPIDAGIASIDKVDDLPIKPKRKYTKRKKK